MSARKFFEFLAQPQQVRIFVPRGEDERVRADGGARHVAGNVMEVRLLEGEIAKQDVEGPQLWLVSMDTPEGTLSIYAEPLDWVDSKRLKLEARQSFSYQQKREFFRVETSFAVALWEPANSGKRPKDMYRCKGEAVNISAGGILVRLRQALPEKLFMRMALHLPGPKNEVFMCSARVVRSQPCNNGEHDIGFAFEEMEEAKRERLLSFCMAEQRRQLREKVQVTGY